MLRLFLWRELARQFPNLSGQTTPLCFQRIIELFSLPCWLAHDVNLFDLFVKRKQPLIYLRPVARRGANRRTASGGSFGPKVIATDPLLLLQLGTIGTGYE